MGSMTAGLAGPQPSWLRCIEVSQTDLYRRTYTYVVCGASPPIDAVLCWLAAHQAPSAANETALGRDPCFAWQLCCVWHGVNT